MNKKTYQQPTTEVVKMQYQTQMLCGSPKELEGTPDAYQELE